MKSISIKNKSCSACISVTGAELRSWITDGTEQIWEADPGIWSGSAPILFPVVGKMKNDMYTFDGREYTMVKHGLVRKREFNLLSHSESEAEFSFIADEEALKSYPFNFELKVRFSLEGKKLNVNYQVINNGNESMYFCIGSHPALALPLSMEGEDTSLTDYYIEFGSEENLELYRLVGGLITTEGTPFSLDDRRIYLSEGIFSDDALIFKGINSNSLVLGNDKTGRKIKMETGGAPDLGIWAKPGAPYVCLEPWFGYDDSAEVDGDLTRKPGILSLGAGDTFSTGYSLEVV